MPTIDSRHVVLFLRLWLALTSLADTFRSVATASAELFWGFFKDNEQLTLVKNTANDPALKTLMAFISYDKSAITDIFNENEFNCQQVNVT